LQRGNNEYKQKVDQHSRTLQLEVGDQVLSHLGKVRFQRGTYNKLELRMIGLCKIQRKFGEKTYEIELLEDVGISPIFNIADLYPYREDGTRGS
jgi:hypothetical protein